MKCPHCSVEIHPAYRAALLNQNAVGREYAGDGRWVTFSMGSMQCPACEGAILRMSVLHGSSTTAEGIVFPQVTSRAPAPQQVPQEIAEDFNEGALVVDASPKASAALSRRCLQALLRDKGFTQHDLAKQIDAVLAAKVLPSSLADNVDAIRNSGNFAAHPMKDTNSGAILPVEPHEAEWNLEVLEGLFDFFYVAPARDAARKSAFNAKLAAAGKPPMK